MIIFVIFSRDLSKNFHVTDVALTTYLVPDSDKDTYSDVQQYLPTNIR